MIGLLRGALRHRGPSRLLLDVGGVGYDVVVPTSTLLELPEEGQQVELLIHTQVREDAITLYGFRSPREKEVFERLLGVSGVGPRTALAALSALGPEPLVSAIRDGDARRISAVPGIGRKTAERLIVDLRDRLEPGAVTAAVPAGPSASSEEDDVVSALCNLGYPERQARKAVEAARAADDGAGLGFDDLLRRTLQSLAKG